MPLYDFQCPGCSAVEEHLSGMTIDDEVQCTSCNQAMQRLEGCGRVAAHVKGYTYGITHSGERIKGQFGGSAPKKFRQRR